MKKHVSLSFERHVKLFMAWIALVVHAFPPLWKAAKGFAPLVLNRCQVCVKPVSVFWVPAGDHTLCGRLDNSLDRDEPLPPFV